MYTMRSSGDKGAVLASWLLRDYAEFSGVELWEG